MWDSRQVSLKPQAYTCSCVVIAHKFRNEPDKFTLLTSGLVQVFRSVIRQCIYIYVQNYCRRDFGFSPWCKWDPRPSRVKQSKKWTAVQEVDCFSFQDGAYRSSRHTVNYQSKLRNIPEERIFQNYCCSIYRVKRKHMMWNVRIP